MEYSYNVSENIDLSSQGQRDVNGSLMLAVNADYGWTEWNEWSECSATCGEGVSERTRECLIAGGFCNGDASQTRVCNLGPCGREYTRALKCSYLA